MYCYVGQKRDCITETESQLKKGSVYKKVTFKQDMLCDLVTKSNGCFKESSAKCAYNGKGTEIFKLSIKKNQSLRKVVLTSKNP